VDKALRQGARARGFDTDLWTLARVARSHFFAKAKASILAVPDAKLVRIPTRLIRLENRPGDWLLVAWNDPTTSTSGWIRWSPVVAYSPDGGKTWSGSKQISNPNPEKGYRADYPTICQTKEGLIILVWQDQTLPRHQGKELQIARFNRAWLIQK
jgi:hypothetical protein